MTGEQYLELPREKWDPLATAGVFLCALMLLSHVLTVLPALFGFLPHAVGEANRPGTK